MDDWGFVYVEWGMRAHHVVEAEIDVRDLGTTSIGVAGCLH